MNTLALPPGEKTVKRVDVPVVVQFQGRCPSSSPGLTRGMTGGCTESQSALESRVSMAHRQTRRGETLPNSIHCVRLGLTAYAQALQVQRRWHASCVARRTNVLLLTQHQPVITLGYRRPGEQIRLSAAQLREKGLSVEYVERGGGATYHAPGQLVAYPIFSSLLQRYGVRRFVAQLEEVMQQTCLRFGVHTSRQDGYPGVWVGEKKIGAVGIAVRKRVSLHGFALNVDLDLRPFASIVPCGLADRGVTSLQQECARPIAFSAVERAVVENVATIFEARMEDIRDGESPD